MSSRSSVGPRPPAHRRKSSKRYPLSTSKKNSFEGLRIRSGYRLEQFQPIDHRSRGRHRSSEGKIIVGTRTISVPTDIWVKIGSPVYLTKVRHAPTGELHFCPATKEEPLARKVAFSLSGGRGLRVRLAMSAREQMVLKPGMYPAEVARVLGRPVIIITGALHEQSPGSKHGQ